MPLSLDGTGSITGIGTFNFSDEIVHVGDTNTKIRFPANDTITAETSGVERFRIRSDGKIGIGICWDQWFAEAARIMALKGAEVLFYPTAIGDEIMSTYDSSDAWQTVMQGHAAANIMPVVASNRIGSESVKDQVNGFYGKSFICNRSGKIIAEASKDKEEIILAEIDTEENHLFRRNWGLFRDRRPELYKEILSLNGELKD